MQPSKILLDVENHFAQNICYYCEELYYIVWAVVLGTGLCLGV